MDGCALRVRPTATRWHLRVRLRQWGTRRLLRRLSACCLLSWLWLCLALPCCVAKGRLVASERHILRSREQSRETATVSRDTVSLAQNATQDHPPRIILGNGTGETLQHRLTGTSMEFTHSASSERVAASAARSLSASSLRRLDRRVRIGVGGPPGSSQNNGPGGPGAPPGASQKNGPGGPVQRPIQSRSASSSSSASSSASALESSSERASASASGSLSASASASRSASASASRLSSPDLHDVNKLSWSSNGTSSSLDAHDVQESIVESLSNWMKLQGFRYSGLTVELTHVRVIGGADVYASEAVYRFGRVGGATSYAVWDMIGTVNVSTQLALHVARDLLSVFNNGTMAALVADTRGGNVTFNFVPRVELLSPGNSKGFVYAARPSALQAWQIVVVALVSAFATYLCGVSAAFFLLRLRSRRRQHRADSSVASSA